MTKKKDGDGVGFGRPPKQHRFVKGQSGNPAGSSKKQRVRNMLEPEIANIWAEEGERLVTINENGGPKQITMARLNIRRAYLDGAAGKVSALRITTTNILRAEELRRDLWKERTISAGELKAEQVAEWNRQKAAGVTNPKVYPHPDDIYYNPASGEVEVMGPTTEQEHNQMLEIFELLKQTISIFLETERIYGPSPEGTKYYLARVDELNSLLPERYQLPAYP